MLPIPLANTTESLILNLKGSLVVSYQGRVLVPGNSCVGLTFSANSQFIKQGIFITLELDLKDYQKIVESVAVVSETAEAMSHIAVVCRILGIPVVILDKAMQLLPVDECVTVDAHSGRITHGEAAAEVAVSFRIEVPESDLRYQLSIIDLPDLIKRVNSLARGDVEHFFIREEFIWTGRNLNPFGFFKSNGATAISELLLESLLSLVRCLEANQLLNFRSLDFRSDQWAEFGEPLPHEPNPQLGMHGIRQLLRCQEYLAAELAAVDQLYERGFSNVIYSIPFLTLESELQAVLKLRQQICKNPVKVGIFVETPAAVSELPYLIDQDIYVVYVGTKDLAQLILAADRDNSAVADILSATCRPVIQAISSVVEQCLRAGLPVFVFTLPEELPHLRSVVPKINRVSMPVSDYIRVFSTRTEQAAT